MERYESYKPSGVKWLGDIPENWDVRRNIGLFDERKEINQPDMELLSVTINRGVIKQEEITEKKDSSKEDKSKYKVVRKDDLAYNKMRMWQGAIGRSEYEGIVSPAYVILSPRDRLYSRYYHYLYRTEAFIAEANRHSYGLCLDMNSLRYEDFKTIYSPVPPRTDVERIVAFLDQKTAEIDAVIAKKERLIGLLYEQKSVLIKQAVSRGLQPKVAMRNSGIPWLGEVPSHWQVLPIRRIAKTVKTGKTPPSDSKFDGFEDGNILWFSPGDFREDGAFERSSRLVNQRAVKHGHVEIFAANSIYFIGIGATLGKACVSKIPASCNQQVNVISLSEGHDPDFFVYQLNSIRQDVFGLAEFTTMPILNQMGTKRIKVAIPPSEEQREISSYVKRISETYKSAIDAQQRLISSLREMRSKTIAETVKGNVRI